MASSQPGQSILDGAADHGFARNPRHPSKAEWQAKRSIIKQLYIDSNQTLNQVMATLSREHGFHAKRKMYVTRLAAWGLFKNYTEPKVHKLLHEKRVHSGVLKASKFGRDGNSVDVGRIEKYLKRKNTSLSAFITGEVEKSVAVGIEATTQALPAKDREPSAQRSTDGDYEPNCPYRLRTTKSRLIEGFPDGASYEGDSFGFHSCLAADEERPCTEHGFLDFKLWKKSAQDSLQRGISTLEECSSILDDDSDDDPDEEMLPPIQQGLFDQPPMGGESVSKKANDLQSFPKSPIQVELNIPMSIKEMLAYLPAPKPDPVVQEGPYLDQDLFRASEAGNLEKVRSLLYLGVNPNPQSSPPLFAAARNGHFAVTELLLLQGANAKRRRVSHALVEAASGGHLKVAQLLIDWGADVNPDEGYKTPLIGAVRAGEISMARLLLDNYANCNARGFWTRWTTPLAEAALKGDIEMAKLLLDRGAKLINEAAKGRSRTLPDPLFEAIKEGHVEMERILFRQYNSLDADFPYFFSPTPPYQTSKTGRYTGYTKCFQLGRYLFHRMWMPPPLRDYLSVEVEASKNANGDGIQGLLNWGSQSPEICAYLFVEAVKHGDANSIQSLWELGWDQFESISYIFSSYITQFFQENKQQLDHLQRQLETPLILAAASGHSQKVAFLLELGANINTITSLGTPLSFAAQAGHKSVIRQLLREGAEIKEAAIFLERHIISGLSRVLKKINTRKMRRSACSNSTKFQNQQHLRRKFIAQHILMLKAAESSSTHFRELKQQLPTYRKSWSAGIRTLRSLSRGETPTSFANIMAFLFIAKSIADTLERIEGHDRRADFFQDLGRWKLLFTSASDIDAYRDAINSMWGVVLDELDPGSLSDPDVLIHFQELATTLISQARDQFGLDALDDSGLESSQKRWQLRNDKTPSSAGPTDTHPDVGPSGRKGQPPPDILHPQPPDPVPYSRTKTLNQEIKDDVSVIVEPLVILLMAGAIFAIVLIFLQWLQSVSITGVSNLLISCATSTLEERCRILERYMGLKEYNSLIPGSSLTLEEER